MPYNCAVFVINQDFRLLLNAYTLFSQPVHKRVLINQLAMPMTQIAVNLEACFTNYITKRKDISHVRIGIHVRCLSVLFVLFVPFCGYLNSNWPKGASVN